MGAQTENTPLITTHQSPASPTKQQSSAKETLLRFALLPSQIYTILLLEFLNTFRSYGLRIILFNYITNEYSIRDVDAGALLGIKSVIDIGVGLVGCIAVDFVGVRRLSLLALSMAIVSRALLAFGRSTNVLYAVLFVGSPLGDALLSIGLYRVALKKLTTPRTRPMGFAISYAVQNFAGVCVAFLVDWMRSGDDIEVDFKLIGGIYTPVRQFVVRDCIYLAISVGFMYHVNAFYLTNKLLTRKQVVTWLVVLLTFVIALLYLEDLTVTDSNDPDTTDLQVKFDKESSKNDKNKTVYPAISSDDALNHKTLEPELGQCSLIRPAKPMFDSSNFYRWLPHIFNQKEIEQLAKSCKYQTFHTIHAKTTIAKSSPIQSIHQFIQQLLSILQLRNSWRVIVFSFATVLVSLQWTASDISLPPFLERRFGEEIPIYTIQNIHMFGCMILPPVVGAWTSGIDDFDIILPGLWIMALSPVMLVLSPTVFGASCWQVALTIGQVLWSPRQDSWVASLAPCGMEGLFFAVSCSRALLVPLVR
jgi:hypothetical protein